MKSYFLAADIWDFQCKGFRAKIELFQLIPIQQKTSVFTLTSRLELYTLFRTKLNMAHAFTYGHNYDIHIVKSDMQDVLPLPLYLLYKEHPLSPVRMRLLPPVTIPAPVPVNLLGI